MLFLCLCALSILACNREGPLDVIGVDDNSAVAWSVKNTDNPDSLIYTVYLPASWCSRTNLDSLRPWAMVYINGVASLYRINDIQTPDPGRMNYFRYKITLSRYDAVQVLLNYGNYMNGNDPNNASIASIKGRNDPYAVVYQPNLNRADDCGLIGCSFYGGFVGPLNNNLLLPIRAEVGIDLPVRVGVDARFTVDNLSYTAMIGMKSIVWEFSDGYKRYGREVFQRFSRAGQTSVTLTLTDNLDKKLVLTKAFTVN